MTAPAIRLDWLYAYAVFFVVLLYGPVILLPLFSFNDSIYIAFPLKGFTARWYQEMVDNPFLMAALRNSLKVGVAVAIVATALGLVAARHDMGKTTFGYRWAICRSAKWKIVQSISGRKQFYAI